MKKLLWTAVAVLVAVVTITSCGGSDESETDSYSIGVFVPGVVEGSPTYEMLVEGVERAVAETEPSSTFKVVEGGFNQALWEQGLTSMAASGEYDLIVSSNPEIPDIVVSVLESFPEQRFLLMDAWLNDDPQVHTVMFNQREQAFLAGHFAGLVGRSNMVDPRDTLRAGLLAGQEYPIMNEVIVPGYELGLKSVDPDATVDFRVLGNWYDAGRAAELASSMYTTGSHIVLPIAGGGNQGVISAARDHDRYVIWYDTPGLDEAPGIVVGSTYVALDEAAYERSLSAINGELAFGEAEILGVADGYVGFVQDDSRYRRHVDEAVRSQMALMVEKMERGEVYLEMPLE
ncbi:MAG: BMP family ABC transporter substrate-binding protein [Spirochaetota bacterium]